MAVSHLFDEIDTIYKRLEDNPYQFADCRDVYLKSKGYKEAIVGKMDYIVIFRVDGDIVYILGVFHSLENYNEKL